MGAVKHLESLKGQSVCLSNMWRWKSPVIDSIDVQLDPTSYLQAMTSGWKCENTSMIHIR